MKAWRIGLLCFFAAIVGSISVCEPAWLAKNGFLLNLMTHELLGLLVVILTITFASVANIHLAISRMVSRAANRSAAGAAANSVRREINSNAWTIFAAFLVALASLVLKGAFQDNDHVVAVAHAVGLTVIALNVLVLHDIYRSIFGLAAADTALDQSEDAPSTH